MSSNARGSGSVSPQAVFDRTVRESVRQAKLAVRADPVVVTTEDDASFMLSVRSFASRGTAVAGGQATLTFGEHLTGGSYDGAADVTIATDATSSNVDSTIMARDSGGNTSVNDINVVGAVHGNVQGDLTGDVDSGGTSTFNVANVGTVNATDVNVSDTLTALHANTGDLTCSGEGAFNGASLQAAFSVGAAATNAGTTQTLANNLRAALIAWGIATT